MSKFATKVKCDTTIIFLLMVLSFAAWSEKPFWSEISELPPVLDEKVKDAFSYSDDVIYKGLRHTKRDLYCGQIKSVEDSSDNEFRWFYVAENVIQVERGSADREFIDVVCSPDQSKQFKKVVKEPPATEFYGSWQLIDLGYKDAIDVSWSGFNLQIDAFHGEALTLMLHCDDNKPMISVIWQQKDLSFGEEVKITYWIDSQKPVTEEWQSSFGNFISRKRLGRNNVKLLLKMFNANTISILLPDLLGSEPVAEFNLDGIDRIAEIVKATCPIKDKYWSKS